MGDITVIVVDLTGATPAIGLAGIFTDIGNRLRRVQEGRHIVGQRFHRHLADHAVARRAPGPGRTRYNRTRQDDGRQSLETHFHATFIPNRPG